MWNSNSFWTGYLFGMADSRNNNENNGCATGGCGCLFLYIILSIIGFILMSIIRYFPKVNYIFLDLYDHVLVKIILFPSTFDLLIAWDGQYWIHIGILIIAYFIVTKISKILNHKSKMLFVYFVFHRFILILRVFGLIAYAITLLLNGGQSDYLDKEKTDISFIEVESTNNMISPTINYKKVNLGNEYETDNLGNGKYQKYLFINFDAPQNNEENAERSITLRIEPKGGISYRGVVDSKLFKTILSYAPPGEERLWANDSTFKFEFIIDGSIVKTFSLSPSDSVIPVEINLNKAESIQVKVSGNIHDRNIVTLLNPIFFANF